MPNQEKDDRVDSSSSSRSSSTGGRSSSSTGAEAGARGSVSLGDGGSRSSNASPSEGARGSVSVGPQSGYRETSFGESGGGAGAEAGARGSVSTSQGRSPMDGARTSVDVSSRDNYSSSTSSGTSLAEGLRQAHESMRSAGVTSLAGSSSNFDQGRFGGPSTLDGRRAATDSMLSAGVTSVGGSRVETAMGLATRGNGIGGGAGTGYNTGVYGALNLNPELAARNLAEEVDAYRVGRGLAPANQDITSGQPKSVARADISALTSYLEDPEKRASLPAGMRNNNPGNIKFVGQNVPGIVGPSKNKDQGDPQAVFDTPYSGLRAMISLEDRKYTGGKTTPNSLIAGDMGWTPGNYQAAANVARSMGIGPNDDINFKNPESAAAFTRALISQEHGKMGALYTDDIIAEAVADHFAGRPVDVGSSGAVTAYTPSSATRFSDKYLGATPTQAAAAEQKPGLTTGQQVLAGAIDIGTGFLPVVGQAAGLVNAGLTIAGEPTIGQRLVAGIGTSGMSAPDTLGQPSDRDQPVEEKPEDKPATPVISTPTVQAFVNKYIGPTPQQKWGGFRAALTA